jgi:hypothetical protein
MSRKVNEGDLAFALAVILGLVIVCGIQNHTIEKQRIEIRKVVQTHCGLDITKQEEPRKQQWRFPE